MDAAIEAAAKAINDCRTQWPGIADELARAAVAAALPHIRSALADEIEALKVPTSDLDQDEGFIRANQNVALDAAARVARGGPLDA